MAIGRKRVLNKIVFKKMNSLFMVLVYFKQVIVDLFEMGVKTFGGCLP